MRKTLLITLSVILLSLNFIPRDINNELPYDGKERFYPELAYIQSISQLEAYVDSAAALKNYTHQSSQYTALLAYVISCRFYHGFSHWKLNENWIAAVGQKITGIGLACKVNPEDIMKSPNAACSQQALVMMNILRNKGINYRKVGFPHHYAIEVNIGNNWFYFDPNMEPRMNLAQREHKAWGGINDHLKQYYNPAVHKDLDYQFGHNEMAELGSINEIPAQRAAAFQAGTSFLSKILWCFPLIFAFIKRRKPSMYALRPINKRPVYRINIHRPFYYA